MRVLYLELVLKEDIAISDISIFYQARQIHWDPPNMAG